MHLVTDETVNVDSGAPELFTERLMQVQLGRFWRRFGSRRNSEYDPTQAEQTYEQFCAEYLPSLSPAFALKPDTKWDRSFPRLAMQRQLLYICIFDSICWNFRPLLLLKPSQIASLPLYKQVLLQSQKKVLAIAALRELEAISALHAMFNGSYTQFGAIIFNTFEASVLLLTLCTDPGCPVDDDDNLGQVLGLEGGRLNRKRFIQAAERGLERLQMLAEINDMAASGARTLAQLFFNVSKDVDSSVSPMTSDESSWSASLPSALSDLLGYDPYTGYPVSSDYPNASLMAEPLPLMAPEGSYSNLQLPSLDFMNTLDFE